MAASAGGSVCLYRRWMCAPTHVVPFSASTSRASAGRRAQRGTTLQGKECTSSSVRLVGDGLCQCRQECLHVRSRSVGHQSHFPLLSAGSDRESCEIVGVVELRPDLQSPIFGACVSALKTLRLRLERWHSNPQLCVRSDDCTHDGHLVTIPRANVRMLSTSWQEFRASSPVILQARGRDDGSVSSVGEFGRLP